MSKLADAIRRSQRVESAPMGFGTARSAAKATMLVGFRGAAAGLEGAQKAGADLLLVEAADSDLTATKLKQLRTAATDLPLGALPKSAAGNTKELREAGLDFIAFDPESTPAAALLDEDMGYVLVLPDQLDDVKRDLFLRSLEALSLEAVYLSSVPSPLTVTQQIELGRVGLLSRKPLICQVKPDASSDDLQCLRGAGVVALLVDSAAAVSKLKETVAALPPRRQRKDDRPVVSLPRGAQAPAEDDDDDDE